MQDNETIMRELRKADIIYDSNISKYRVNPKTHIFLTVLFFAAAVGCYFFQFIIGVVIGTILAVIFLVKAIRNATIWEALIQQAYTARIATQQAKMRGKAVALYKECIDNGITDLTTKAAVDRLSLIGKKHGFSCSIEDLIETYNEGKSQVSTVAEAQKTDEIEEALSAESVIINESTKYLGFYGRDKMVQMYSDIADKYRQEVKDYQEQARQMMSGGLNIYDTFKERETSWALVGGAVSGIAGGAAGLAAAIDVQNKNQDIKARNSALLSSVVNASADIVSKIYDAERKAQTQLDRYTDKANRAQLKLVEETDPAVLLDRLSPRASKIEKLETGSVRFKVKFKHDCDTVIYDNIQAVIDGHIRAKLKASGDMVGTADFSLPCDGSVSCESIICICQNVSPSSDFTVEFEPISLWAIEADK